MAESDHFDALETRKPEAREADLAARLPAVIAKAMTAPGWAKHLEGIDPRAVADRAALARLPVLYKSSLPERQAAEPPFGGLVAEPLSAFSRLFVSPGPVFEPEPAHPDPANMARSLFAAGFRAGEVVLNTFSYHMTPGGLMLDQAARALGCPVIPAGPGNTEQQLQVLRAYRPAAYCGTPDFLKILLDAGRELGRDTDSIEVALVTSLDSCRHLVRFSLGDLSAILPGVSPCGRTNQLIKGWMGRAEQAAKVRGMFVTPAQIAEVARRHREVSRLQLVIARSGEQDVMTLKAETQAADPALAEALAATLAAVTKLKGTVELLAPGSLANDGKVIVDTRPVG